MLLGMFNIEVISYSKKVYLMTSFLCVFQLEDDVVAKAGYYSDMKTFASQEASKPWLYLEFSHLGFIGVSLCVYEDVCTF